MVLDDSLDVCLSCGQDFDQCDCGTNCQECGEEWERCICSEVTCSGCGEPAEDCLCDGLLEDDGMTDAEADADTFRSVGWGTDEDYGYFGDEGDF